MRQGLIKHLGKVYKTVYDELRQVDRRTGIQEKIQLPKYKWITMCYVVLNCTVFICDVMGKGLCINYVMQFWSFLYPHPQPQLLPTPSP